MFAMRTFVTAVLLGKLGLSRSALDKGWPLGLVALSKIQSERRTVDKFARYSRVDKFPRYSRVSKISRTSCLSSA
jgi:hypothetical protein